MKTVIALISNTCNQLVTWFDGTINQFVGMLTSLANVAIRVLLAYALYALFVQDLLLNVVNSF